MTANSDTLYLARDQTTESGRDKLVRNSDSIYRLRFLAGCWVIYRYERLNASFPEENIGMALDFLRRKQNETPVRRKVNLG